jgi:hypothetical protein
MKAAYLLLAAVLLGLGACKSNAARNDAAHANLEAIAKADKNAASIAREQKLLKKLAGKELHTLNTVIPDLDNDQTNMVMVISNFDCVSCVNAGYDILQQIKEANGVIKTYATGITKEVAIPKDYKETVYEDENNNLHAELNYAPTPVILVLEGNRIIDLHTPEDAGSEYSRNFINEYMY